VSSQRVNVASRLLLIAVMACPGLQGRADTLPPQTLPAIILWPSGTPRITIEDAERWLSQGVSGVALGGTLDEVRGSASVLLAAGVERNFFRMDGTSLDLSLDGVRAAAKTAQSMGMAGLAIDPAALSRRNEGPFDGETTPLAIEGARTWGRQFAEAIRAELPEGQVLIAVPSPESADPILLGALLGFCDGLENSTSLHLIVPGGHEPNRVRASAARFRRLLGAERSLDDDGDTPFKGAVDVSLGLETAASAKKATSRERLISAMLYADSIVCISPEALASDESELLKPEPATGVTTPGIRILDDYVRAGAVDIEGVRAEVLRGSDGAALVFLSGIPKPLALDCRRQTIRVTDLHTGQVQTVSIAGGRADIKPSEDPILIEQLPVSAWVAPAGLWLEADASRAGTSAPIPVRFGWANRTELSFSGTLETVSPDRMSLLPRTHVVNLGPGDELSVAGALQGRAEPGSLIPIRLVLTSPGGAPITGTFPIAIPPRLLWQAATGWSPGTRFTLLDLEGDGGTEVVVSAFDSVTSLDGSGRVVWQLPVPGAGNVAPSGGRHWSGTGLVASSSANGITVRRGDGSDLWSVPQLGALRAVQCGNLSPFPGDEIVTGTDKGVVSAFLSNGHLLWSTLTNGPIADLELEDVDGDGRDECLISSAGLIALDGDGQELWRALDDSASFPCPLLIADLDGNWQWSIVAGLADGRIAILDAATGDVIREEKVPTGSIVGLASGELLEHPGQEILVATSERLYCMSTQLTRLWDIPLPLSAAPAVTGSGEEARILAPTRLGSIVCLDANGRDRWREDRAAGAITAAPAVVSLNDAEGKVCIYGSEDGFIRAIQLPDETEDKRL
jgi:outer membrane protein assembly factor BamB